MAAPMAVQRRAEKARELARQAQQPQQQPRRQQASEEQRQPNQHVEANQEQPVNEQPVQETVAPQTAFDAPVELADLDWETRYKNLRKARNEKLEAERKRAEQLEQQLIKLAAQPQSSEEGAPRRQSQFDLTEEERKDLSEEEQKIYDRMASKIACKFEVEEVDDFAQREAVFFDDVSNEIPQWQQINADPRFMEWLNQKDGFSKHTRHETLKQARANLDAETVTTLFSAFVNELSNTQGNNLELEQRVSVEPQRGNVQPANQGQPQIISQDYVKAFYAKKNELVRRKRMTPELKEQYAAQDAEIRRAVQEGRVR